MKIFLLTIVVAALVGGCAHRGGMNDSSYRESGYNRSGAYGPSRPSSTMERDFPGRVGPGSDRPLDPAIPR